MHIKTLRLFTTTLLFSLTTLLSCCGNSSHSAEAEEPIKSSRFSAEKVSISGSEGIDKYLFDPDSDYKFFDFSFIITDNQSGQQWLYLFHDAGTAGGATMVELNTTEVTESMDE